MQGYIFTDVPDRVILNSSVMKRKNQMPSKHPNMPKRFAYQKSGPPTSLFFSENSRAAYSHRTPINKMNPFYHNNRENTRKTNFNKMMLADPLNNDDGRRNKKKVRVSITSFFFFSKSMGSIEIQ